MAAVDDSLTLARGMYFLKHLIKKIINRKQKW